MKYFLSLLFLFCLSSRIFGQEPPTECAANAGKDKSICYTDLMTLSAPANLNYANPPGAILWTYLGTVPGVSIAHPDQLTTEVTHSGANWTPGDYHFRLCVTCQDLNGDHVNDHPCDEVVITVKPDVTQPVITGAQNGTVKACSQAIFNVNTPASGETAALTFLPDDNLLSYTIVNGVARVTRQSVNYGGECNYTATYTITNGGCTKKTTVQLQFVSPYDPNNDGVIEGQIQYCPSCSNTLNLYGDFPGCGGIGTWTKVSGPGTMSYVSQYLPGGDATITVSQPGTYIFRYTVSNVSPCVTTPFDITCVVYEIGTFSLGPDKFKTFCQTTIPAGTYAYCFNQLPNTIYNWTSSVPGITFSNPHGACSDVIIPAGISLLGGPVYITVTATKYFQDRDCAGPMAPTVVTLPSTDPNVNWAFIQDLIAHPGNTCISQCTAYGQVQYSGAPQVKVKAGPVNFLCSSGSETIRLGDYFTVINLVNLLQVTCIDQPIGQGIPNILGTTVNANDLLQLPVNGCGQYKFKIVATNYDYAVNPPTACSSTGFLTINIETPQQATAGTDQIKCINEPIRLNANNPYCYAQGTWTQVGCNSPACLVTIVEPHEPNTQITLSNTLVPPATLRFQWTFESVDQSCVLIDETIVQVNDCIAPCPENLSIKTTCVDGKICLTVLDQFNNILPPAYTVTWPLLGQTGNPVCVQGSGPIAYDAVVTLNYHNGEICRFNLSGTASCVSGCNARIEERCDEYGNIILTLVDALGNTILPSTFDEIFWSVYGSGVNDDSPYSVNLQNPITIQQDACYSLRYQHIIPPHILECSFIFPKVCPSITCHGPCENFNDFFIAGCGDLLDQTLNLTFPNGCQSFCGNIGTSGMLGVFYKSNDQPVIPSSTITITWRDGTHGTYASGNLNTINSVTITNERNCFWKDKYVPQCCSTPTPFIECQQPITKYCREDGSVYYVTGSPQIFWTPVPGATGYIVEITTGTVEGCCTGVAGTTTQQVSTNVYIIPTGATCFSIRIKAIIPGCPDLQSPDWSYTYVYCPREVVCNPKIIVCGCCHGRSEDNNLGIQTQLMSEEDLLAYLKANPGTEYNSLQDALYAIGIQTAKTTDFKVFPNPVSDQIVVQGNNSVKGNFKVQLTDMLQREWRNVTFDGANENTINVSDLPKGIYLITIRNANGERVLTEKITVLR